MGGLPCSETFSTTGIFFFISFSTTDSLTKPLFHASIKSQLNTPPHKELGSFCLSPLEPFALTADMKNTDYTQFEKEFRALGNQRRLIILSILKQQRNICVIDISNKLDISFQTASKHLLRLFRAGILTRKQVGGEMHYKISPNLPKRIQEAINTL